MKKITEYKKYKMAEVDVKGSALQALSRVNLSIAKLNFKSDAVLLFDF